MQDRGAMRIQHALWLARGAGGIAQARSGIFIKQWSSKFITLRGEQVFVAKQMRQVDWCCAAGHTVAVA